MLTPAATATRAREGLKRGFEPTWRYLFNFGPTMDHRRRPPVLRPAAARALADLNRDGLAVSTLEELTGDPTLLGQLQDLAAALEAEQAEQLAERRRAMADGTFTGFKDFCVHLLGRHPTLAPDSLPVRVGLHEQLKGIADGYFGLRTSLADANIWRNLRSDAEPRSSQLWHRDLHHDHYVLKMFVHLEDVEPGTGPFSYAKGTHGKGDRHVRAEGSKDALTYRTLDEDLARVVPRERWVECTGPAGTVVLADTIGYHRGGWARTEDRLVFQAFWTSKASRRDYQIRMPAGVDRARWAKDIVLAGG